MVSLQYLGTAGVFEDPESGLSWERDGESLAVDEDTAARLTSWPHEHWRVIQIPDVSVASGTSFAPAKGGRA